MISDLQPHRLLLADKLRPDRKPFLLGQDRVIVSPPRLPTNHPITSLHYPISSTRVDLINPGQSEVVVSEALHRRKLHLSSNKNIRYSPYTAGSGYSPEERWKEGYFRNRTQICSFCGEDHVLPINGVYNRPIKGCL